MDESRLGTRRAIPFLIASIAAKPVGFLKEMLVAAVYGSGVPRDAFLIAWQIPSWIGAVVTEGLPQTLVPYLAEIAPHDRERRILGGLLGILALVFVGLAAAILFGANPLVRLVAPFASAETHVLATGLLQILAVAVVLMGASAVLSAMLLARRRFVAATLGVPLMNLVIMAVVVLGHRTLGIRALAYGTVAGAAVVTLALLPQVATRPRLPRAEFRRHYRRFFAVLGAFFAGTLLFNVNALAERMFASTLPAGGISNLDYAFRLVQMLFTLLALLPTYLFPRLCELASAEPGHDGLGALLARGARATVAVGVPLAAFVWAVRQPLVATVYERGAFDAPAARATSELVGLYALGLAVHALNNMVMHGFYALGAVRVRVVYGALFLVANLTANFLLVERLGGPALALANTLAATVCCIYLLVALHRRGAVLLAGLPAAAGRAAIVALLVAAAAAAIVHAAPVVAPLRLVLAAAAAAAIAWLAARILRVEELSDLWGSLAKARLR